MIRAKRPVLIYLCLLPPALLLLLFSYAPAFSAFRHAFYEWDVGGTEKYIGVGNFRRMAADPVVLIAFRNLFLVLLVNVSVKLFVPLMVAVLIYRLRSEGGRYFYRVMFVIPMVVPAMVTTLLWGFIYSDSGILTEGMKAVGLARWTTGWLDDPKTALWAIIGVGFPFVWGFNLLICYAGLANISESVIEAAQIDGAGPLRRFFSIELPLISGQMKLLTILTLIGSVQQYDLPLILANRGGPGFETMLPGLWLYISGFSLNRMGYACAIGCVLFCLMLFFTVLNLQWVFRAKRMEG